MKPNLRFYDGWPEAGAPWHDTTREAVFDGNGGPDAPGELLDALIRLAWGITTREVIDQGAGGVVVLEALP